MWHAGSVAKWPGLGSYVYTAIPHHHSLMVQRELLTSKHPSFIHTNRLAIRIPEHGQSHRMSIAGNLDEGFFSVWAMPSRDHPGLKQSMEFLRERYKGPAFEPHVTVLGVQKLPLSQASACLQAACRSLRPFTCRLSQLGCGQSFYQCVYMLVEPTEEVMQANLHAKNSFGLAIDDGDHRQNRTGYMPHLSLLYSDLTIEEKQKAKKKVEEEFGPLICGTEFRVSSLCLYSTDTQDKLLESWMKVAEYPLEGKENS